MSDSILRFDQIIGQDAAIKTLKAALPPGQPGTGYLFAGPEGVGKMSAAMAWARALFCAELRGQDACGHCAPCRKTSNGTNPDLLILRPEVGEKKVKEEISIDNIRALIERLGYKPYESERKVAIVDEADKMNSNAANAFLKTLEEPPGDTVIILVASNQGRLPLTIVSRCRMVRFNPVPFKPMVEYLVREKGMERKRAGAVAALSKGAIGAVGAERLKEDMEMRSMALDFIAQAPAGSAARYFKLARTMDKAKERETVDRFLLAVLSLLRELAVMKFTRKYDNLVNIDIIEELEKAARNYSGRRILDAASVAESLMAARSLHINPFLAVSLLYCELRNS